MNARYVLGCFLAHALPVYASVIYVNAGATGANDGTSWSNARTSLSAAIDSAEAGDEVWVTEGTYRPIALKSGVKVCGGFTGAETAAWQSDPAANPTLITGGGTARAVVSIDNNSSAVLRGFAITDGFVDIPDTGAGLYLKNSNATFVACVFTGNRAVAMGGAVANWGGSPRFVNCRFFGNDGGWGGGAVWNRKSGAPTFANCLFYGNQAEEGGAVCLITGPAKFTNCTFTDNEATNGKAGALFDTRGEAVLRNCIVWSNVAAKGGTPELYNKPGAGRATTVTHSDVKGGWPGTGNIASDPLFANATTNDFRLQSASPCADLGRRSSLPPDLADLDWDGDTAEALPTDLHLDTRSSGTSVDAGAYRRISP